MGGLGWLNMIPQLPDFAGMGLNWAIYKGQRNDYAQQVRHLRRREYQDMMFSMKKAGLNPMLASGATPGHSAAFSGHGVSGSPSAGVGTATAANRAASAAMTQAESDKGKKGAETDYWKQMATNAQYDQNETIARTNNFYSGAKLNEAKTLEALGQTPLTTAQQAKVRAETDKILASMPMAIAEGKYGAGPATLIGSGRFLRDTKNKVADEVENSALATSAAEFRRWLEQRK